MELYTLDIDENEDDQTSVFAVGLVERPAIERNWMAFAGTKEKFSIVDDEKMILAGPLMVANQPIYRNDNGHEYEVVFPTTSIEKIVRKYARSGKSLSFNINHNDSKPVKGAFLMQHFIIDSTIGLNTPKGFDELADGSWFGFVKVDDRTFWDNHIKTGDLKGFSVEGYFNDFKVNKEEKEYEELKNTILSCLN